MRYLLCLFAAILFIFTFSACIDEDLRSFYEQKKAENAASSEALKKAASSTISENSVSESSSDENSKEQNSASEKSGSTQIDNKPPKQGIKVKEDKDGVTIHIPQSELDDLSEAVKEFSQKIDDIPVYSYDEPSFTSRDDIKYRDYDDWKDKIESGREGSSYSWENDD